MSTLELSNPELPTGSFQQSNGFKAAHSPCEQIVKDFFLTDKSHEIIKSLHVTVEAFLFNENLTNVTPEMRSHIVAQLRVATLVAKLDAAKNQ